MSRWCDRVIFLELFFLIVEDGPSLVIVCRWPIGRALYQSEKAHYAGVRAALFAENGGPPVSNDPAQSSPSKQKEFMTMLPLILEIAGLPRAEPGRHFTPEQMEVRALTLKNAYKAARQLLLDLSK